jgi:uncharacterized protein (TIGR02444 family)
MSLWDWAVTAYAAPGVSEACLELQDAHGQSVPLLLWAAWTAREGRPLDEDAVDAACDTARIWDEIAIAPLRAVRRRLKTRTPDMDDAAREAVREQVKAVELDSERRLLLALEGVAPAKAGSPRDALKAMSVVARAWSPITPRPALIRLSERLPA